MNFSEDSDWGLIIFVVQTPGMDQIYPFNYRKPKLINQDSIKYAFYHSKGIKKNVDKGQINWTLSTVSGEPKRFFKAGNYSDSLIAIH